MSEGCLFSTMKNSVAMEDSELLQPPRKRQKLSDARSDQSVQTAKVPTMASEHVQDAGAPQSIHNEQLSKEAEVGITEFVSPGLSGFVGILKKR